MLVLRKRAPAVQVPLGRDAWIKVRPATQFEVDSIFAEVKRMTAGVVEGSAALEQLGVILGDAFDGGDLADEARMSAASLRLAEVLLVMACQDGWSGVGDEDGHPIDAPTDPMVALILNDPAMRGRIMNVINASIHVEVDEGNGLPVSLHGGAGIQDGAQAAAPKAPLVPTANASPTDRTVN